MCQESRNFLFFVKYDSLKRSEQLLNLFITALIDKFMKYNTYTHLQVISNQTIFVIHIDCLSLSYSKF